MLVVVTFAVGRCGGSDSGNGISDVGCGGGDGCDDGGSDGGIAVGDHESVDGHDGGDIAVAVMLLVMTMMVVETVLTAARPLKEENRITLIGALESRKPVFQYWFQ